MAKLVSSIHKIVSKSNKKKGVWSYLTSIEYMLSSKLYMDELKRDAKKVTQSILPGDSILDFGTGSGIFAIHLRDQNKSNAIEAVDAQEDKSENNPNFVDSRKQQKEIWTKFGKEYKINFSHYDGRNISFEDESFDIVTAYAVLEHVPPVDLDFVVKELKRILKKGGLLFIFRCPRKLALVEHLAKILGLGHHDLLFSDAEMKSIVSKSGLIFVEKWRSDMIFEFPGHITNRFYGALKFIDNLLIKTPLNIFAHDVNLIFSKDRK